MLELSTWQIHTPCHLHLFFRGRVRGLDSDSFEASFSRFQVPRNPAELAISSLSGSFALDPFLIYIYIYIYIYIGRRLVGRQTIGR